MNKLITVLALSLTASSAFAGERGNTTVNVMNTVKVATVKVTGSAAASLYNFLDVREVPSKTRRGAMAKVGNNITCYLSYGAMGDMISPIYQVYDCALNVTPEGNTEAELEVHTN